MITIKSLRYQKISAIIIAILIAILSVNSYQSNALVNTSVNYRVHDAITGEYLRSYILDPLQVENNVPATASQYPITVDWSKTGVVKIMNETNYRGTGFVVGPHIIATAAHVLCPTGSIYNQPISSIYLFNQNGVKTMEATPVEYHFPSNHMSGFLGTDYALITVEEDLSAYDHFDLGVPLHSLINNNQTIKLTGFPEKDATNGGNIVNTHTLHNKYTGNGIIVSNSYTNSNNYTLDYTTASISGHSGSPIYIEQDKYGQKYCTVIAIHIQSSSSVQTGTRINTNLLHFYNNNPNLIY